MSIYEKQFVEIFNNSNYNINTIFDVTIALFTNTIIYKDLPLDVIEQFEEAIGWGKKGVNSELTTEFANPFVTHLNPITRTCITAFVPNNEQQITDGPYGIQLMHFLTQEHNYNYKVAIFGEIKRIVDTCHFNRIPPEDVICITMDTIKVINSNIKFKNMELQSNIEQPKLDVIKPRKYQQDIINHMNTHSRDIIKLPCGMGKSMIMICHMLSHQKNSIILVPNIALVEQFEKNIKYVYNQQLGKYPITHTINNKSDNENLNIMPKWVDENYIPQHIIISVYNSFVFQFLNHPTVDGIYALNYEYLYIDEAHHIVLPAKKQIRANIQNLLKNFMDEYKETKDDFIVRLNKSKLGKSFAELIYKYMSTVPHSYLFSATIQPSNICPYNMFGAIQDGFLCKLNIDILIDTHFDSIIEIPFNDKINNIRDYLVKSPHKHIIIYTSRVSTAREIQRQLPFKSAVVTATLTTNTRQEYFEKFRTGEIRALLTVNCISEGVDLPCADCAVFFDDKHSIINIIQCVGRIMRLCESKLSSTLVLTAYKSDDIDDIYKNTLSLINGELGYGNADIRRSVNVVMNMNTQTTSRCEEIKKKVYKQVYEYNEKYFNEICLLSKIKTLDCIYDITGKMPSLDSNISGDKLTDAEYYELVQFVHDNINLPNEAGKLLRALYSK